MTIIERTARLIAHEDEDVSAEVQAILEREGVEVRLNATCIEFTIHCVLDMMYARAPYIVFQRAMHIHPTVSELIPTILGELQPL